MDGRGEIGVATGAASLACHSGLAGPCLLRGRSAEGHRREPHQFMPQVGGRCSEIDTRRSITADTIPVDFRPAQQVAAPVASLVQNEKSPGK